MTGTSMSYSESFKLKLSMRGVRLKEAILFVDGSEESKMAVEELRRKGVKFREIDVRDNGLRGWLLFEYGTTRVPLLVSGSRVLVGLEEIVKALKSW